MQQDIYTILYVFKVNPGDPKYLKQDDFKELARKWAQDFREATFDEVNFNSLDTAQYCTAHLMAQTISYEKE